MGAAPACRRTDGGLAEDNLEDDESRLLGGLGDSKLWPPGFRFHPTDEELILYYLKRRVFRRRIRLPMIGDFDVYKSEPWELPEKSVLRSGDKQWYFFTSRDRKYPNGSRSNRTTLGGYWKATGKDRTISHGSRVVGSKKTLVYHQGRAPKGERTDWVMHEYTLDDRELVNCKNLQDSYALYKLFRKSGPGPKNGEQYGAPFKEEEWNDDNECDDTAQGQENRVEAVPGHLNCDDSVTNMFGNGENSHDDMENLLLQLADEPVFNQQEVGFGADFGSHTIGQSQLDAISSKISGDWCEAIEDMSFHTLQPASVCAQPIETPEVTLLTNSSEQFLLEIAEEYLEIEDFKDPELEIEDFKDPDCPVWGMNDLSNTDHTRGIKEFYDPNDYFDTDFVLAEMLGPHDGTVPPAYFDGFNDYGNTHNQASHMISELWTYDQSFNDSMAVESNQVFMPPSASGVVCDNAPSTLGANSQEQINLTGSESDSWFNSALASLLEAVPSRPAIASENALISRAVECVSSFKGGKIGARFPNTRRDAALGRRRGGHNGGFHFISFVVGLGAVLWLLTTGSAVKILHDIWNRYVT